LIRGVFKEAAETAIPVAWAESQFQMIQSREIYPESNPRKGIVAGDREKSFCIFQIHEPDHHATAVRLGYEDYKTDVEDCVKLAYHIYKDRGNFTAWSVYKSKAYLAYAKR
jgi:hypothetical protein